MNLKIIFILLFSIVNALFSHAQILITDADNGTSNPVACPSFNDGSVQNFFDSGAAAADYSSNENEVITLCPDLVNGGKLSVSFATNIGFTWDVKGSDTLYIYDGSSTAANFDLHAAEVQKNFLILRNHFHKDALAQCN